MSDYYPDAWAVVKLDGVEGFPEGLYKILAGWYGGYAYGDSWKLSSQIVGCIRDNDMLHMKQYSGSTYHCDRHSYRTTRVSHSVFVRYREQLTRNGVVASILQYHEAMQLLDSMEENRQ